MNRLIFPAGYEDESDNETDFNVNFLDKNKSASTSTQQTCLLSANKSSVSKTKQKRRDFFQAQKKDAILGPVTRPQELKSNHNFFVDAVKRNLGLSDDVDAQFTTPITSVNSEVLPNLQKVHELDKKCARKSLWVGDSDCLLTTKGYLLEQCEVAVDLENNTEHSYKGMTALVQLTTVEADYLIDPFPIFLEVKSMIQDIMGKTTILKIFCGGTNDFLNLQQGFGAVFALCLDIQLLDKRIRYVHWKSPPNGLKDLCKTYLNVDIPKGETNRDWRRRPLPDDLRTYAQHDTYYTMAVYQQMKKMLLEQSSIQLLEDAIRDTELMILTTKRKPPKSDNDHTTNPTIRDILQNWRNKIAKLVDESPKHVLSDATIAKLETKTPSNLDELATILGTHSRIIGGNIHGLFRLINERKDFSSETACHKCGILGHCAAQCILQTNRDLQKEYYKKHPENKAHQNRRRNLRKKINKMQKRLN